MLTAVDLIEKDFELFEVIFANLRMHWGAQRSLSILNKRHQGHQVDLTYVVLQNVLHLGLTGDFGLFHEHILRIVVESAQRLWTHNEDFLNSQAHFIKFLLAEIFTGE